MAENNPSFSSAAQPPYPPVGFNPDLLPPLPPLPTNVNKFSSTFQSAPSDPSAPSAPPEASTSAHSNLAYNPDYTPASPPPAYTAASPTAPPLSSPAGHSPNNSNNNNGDSSHYYYNSFQGEPIKPYNPPSLPAASFTENRVAPAAPAAPTPAPALLTHADGSAVSPEEVALALAEVEAERRTAKYKIVKFLKSDNFVFLLIGLATISAIYLILRNNPQFKK